MIVSALPATIFLWTVPLDHTFYWKDNAGELPQITNNTTCMTAGGQSVEGNMLFYQFILQHAYLCRKVRTIKVLS